MSGSGSERTRIVHAGRTPERQAGAVNPPVYHASTILFPTVADLLAPPKHPLETVRYGRRGTPSTFAFQEAVAELEGGDRCLSYPSGLAAITGTFLAFLETGDHVLIADTVYGPTRAVANGLLARMGVETTFYDPAVGSGIADLIRPETKLVFTEAPGSLTFEMMDIPAVAAAARARGVTVAMDNTWASPHFFKPFDHGVDVAIQAATKYIVGHSDAMLGTVTVKDSHFEPLYKAWEQLGYAAAPDDIYLAQRGLRTLAVRLDQHQKTALELARWFQSRPEVERVLYPALETDPGHAIWKRDFLGASGLFGVVLKPVSREALAAMLDNMAYFAMGYSWGGYESLMIPAFPQKLRTATRWDADGPLLRIHAGLEDVADLIGDLEAGFARLAAAG
ncbi:MAG: cystathionine beta-lyase [Alphaproteobacteria bacterium]|nr:cystathionine beta-lyase [Alphaproteobacteria bacterium]MDX5370100.1 cystathionine beta-lyase [Alphaproteobacteria bacterium]